MNFRFVTMRAFPRPFTKSRRGSRFDSDYPKTIDLLRRELSHLRAKNPVIQLAMGPDQIRKTDGLPRAGARPDHPGVIVSFESAYGPMSYACDEFPRWEDNLRGIAKTLERLRLVDLYGVTKSGEQYKGWTALPAPAGAPQTVEEAAEFISRATGGKWSSTVILAGVALRAEAYRAAALKLHPDAGGNHEDFVRLQAAYRLLSAGDK